MNDKNTQYDITSTTSTIDKYVKLNERDRRIKRKLKNGILAVATSALLLLPINKCKSPESPINGNGADKYSLTAKNVSIMNGSDAGGSIQVNGVWLPSGSTWEIDAVNGTATINSIHADAPNYNPSYITGNDYMNIKDRDGSHSFRTNTDISLNLKLIPNTIDTKILAGLVGKDPDRDDKGDGVVYRFDDSKSIRDVGIKKSNENGLEPTETIIKYLNECVSMVNECNGQQGNYIGKITQDYVDKGITHYTKDTTPQALLGLNDDGTIERSGFYTRPTHSKIAVLEEYIHACTGLFYSNGQGTFPYIDPIGKDPNNPRILPEGKTFIYIIKRLPPLFKLSTSEQSPSASTQTYVSPTTRPWGAPKDYQDLTNPSQPGQRPYDNVPRDKRVKKDHQRIRK